MVDRCYAGKHRHYPNPARQRLHDCRVSADGASGTVQGGAMIDETAKERKK